MFPNFRGEYQKSLKPPPSYALWQNGVILFFLKRLDECLWPWKIAGSFPFPTLASSILGNYVLGKKWFNIFRKNSRFQKYINPPKKLTHVPLKKDYFNRKYRVHLPITIDFQGTRFLLSLQFKTAPNWSRVPPWPLAAEVLGHCLRKGRSVNVGQSPRGNVSLHTPPLIISNLQSVTIST